MRILHTGDIHLGDLAGPTKDGENLRRLDTIGCMKAIVEDAQSIKPEVSIIAGDLFNRSRVWADTALDDVNDALEKFVIPLCGCSDEVVLLFGTMNHDNPRAFELIKKATENLSNLHIYTTPAVEKLDTKEGPVQIMAVPGFDKARLRLFYPGMDKEEENRNATALINDTILGLATQLDHSIPAVMAAHYTVSGSEADNGSTFLAGQDVVILPSTIDAAGVDLACFGHIHKPQRLASETPAYYCGSVNQLNFNDEGTEHGFWLHTLQPMMGGNAVASGFIGLPEREHLTLRLSPDTVAQFIADPQSVSFGELVRDKIIRVRYSCTAEQEKALNRADIQKTLTADGAFYVAEIVPEDVEELDSKDRLTEHDGPFEALGRWLEHNDITGDKADRLKVLAEPIIKKADDGRDDGKHTGAFIPHKIEVKNYRSYTEAEFDFGPVRMAMVNGQNGVGKSSLFMDAIADCLYEHTRKEDIGGWVRDGTKSGAITFTFGMGGQEYRVIRTRTKSGRGTLALQRLDPEAGSWADESDTTMKLTQAKIERLLGMDCDTFCSIALIRQDAYGLFLDADSDRRMEVLSSLLGLGVYSRMEEIAKDAAKEQRRKIAATKDRIDVLTEQVEKREDLMIEDAAKVEKIEEAKRTIAEAEQEQKALEQAAGLAASMVQSINSGNKDAVAKLADTLADVTAKQDAAAQATADWVTDYESQLDDFQKKMEGTVDSLDLSDEAGKAAKDTIAEYVQKLKDGKKDAVAAAKDVAASVALALQNGSTPSVPASTTTTVPGHAGGTTDAEDVFVAGENGPELIVGKQGSTVFPTEETDKIIDALNGMEPASDTSNEKKFDQFLQALTGVTVDAPEPGPGESLFDSVLGKVADIVSGKNSDLEAINAAYTGLPEVSTVALPTSNAPVAAEAAPLNVQPNAQTAAQESTDATKEITKRIILEIVGNGSVTVSGGSGDGMSEKAVLELLTNNIKPVLMGVIKDEIFEEGQLSYDY